MCVINTCICRYIPTHVPTPGILINNFVEHDYDHNMSTHTHTHRDEPRCRSNRRGSGIVHVSLLNCFLFRENVGNISDERIRAGVELLDEKDRDEDISTYSKDFKPCRKKGRRCGCSRFLVSISTPLEIVGEWAQHRSIRSYVGVVCDFLKGESLGEAVKLRPLAVYGLRREFGTNAAAKVVTSIDRSTT